MLSQVSKAGFSDEDAAVMKTRQCCWSGPSAGACKGSRWAYSAYMPVTAMLFRLLSQVNKAVFSDEDATALLERAFDWRTQPFCAGCRS